MTDDLPADALCERCYGPVRSGEQAAKLGNIVGCSLLGDPEWVYTFVHRYDRQEGCVRGTAGVWD